MRKEEDATPTSTQGTDRGLFPPVPDWVTASPETRQDYYAEPGEGEAEGEAEDEAAGEDRGARKVDPDQVRVGWRVRIPRTGETGTVVDVTDEVVTIRWGKDEPKPLVRETWRKLVETGGLEVVDEAQDADADKVAPEPGAEGSETDEVDRLLAEPDVREAVRKAIDAARADEGEDEEDEEYDDERVESMIREVLNGVPASAVLRRVMEELGYGREDTRG
jgi:hypothetical protein